MQEKQVQYAFSPVRKTSPSVDLYNGMTSLQKACKLLNVLIARNLMNSQQKPNLIATYWVQITFDKLQVSLSHFSWEMSARGWRHRDANREAQRHQQPRCVCPLRAKEVHRHGRQIASAVGMLFYT